MPEAMTAGALRETSPPNGRGHRLLHDGFVQVKARGRTPFRISTDACRRKHELPAPLRRRGRVLALECERQHEASLATREVALMLDLHHTHAASSAANTVPLVMPSSPACV